MADDTTLDTPVDETPVDAPVEPVSSPDEAPVDDPVETPPEAPVEPPVEPPVPVVPPAPDVPGSPETPPAPAEATAILQPQAPNPVPATASVDIDQVSINTSLYRLAAQVGDLIDQVRYSLPGHEAVPELEAALKSVADIAASHVK